MYETNPRSSTKKSENNYTGLHPATQGQADIKRTIYNNYNKLLSAKLIPINTIDTRGDETKINNKLSKFHVSISTV